MLKEEMLSTTEVINKTMAGNTFTVVDKATNKHVCYKTTYINATGTTIEAKIKGNSYTEIGVISFINHVIPEPNEGPPEPELKFFMKFWSAMINNTAPINFVLWKPCPCIKCGRLLTDPQSITIAAGPRCKKHIGTRTVIQSEFISH